MNKYKDYFYWGDYKRDRWVGDFSGRETLYYSGPFPENTAEALEISIAKWEVILEHVQIHGGMGYVGAHTCGLCLLFVRGIWECCGGCPVSRHTGQTGCHGTPFEDFCRAKAKGNWYKMVQATRAEISYLEDLRDSLPPEWNQTANLLFPGAPPLSSPPR